MELSADQNGTLGMGNDAPREYDPYDPNRKRQRPVAGPRLVDLSQPLPPPDPGPAVARPHQPFKKIRPEAIVPPEDNPMRGWRWLGASLLSRTLWPRDAMTNPVMAYYAGRRDGRTGEDFFGLFPWFLMILIDASIMLWAAQSMTQVWSLGLVEFLLVGLGATVYSACMVALHLRRNMRNLPLEEILLTRLTSIDIVQGFSIRPIAVQSFGILIWSVVSIALAAGANLRIEGTLGSPGLGYLVCVLIFRYIVMGVAIEVGGAYAVRANLCIQSASSAFMRTLFDLALMLVVIIFAAAISFGLVLVMIFIGAIFAIIFPFLFLGGLFAIASFVGSLFRGLGNEAMEFAYLYPDEWWINWSGDENAPERGILAPWKPMANRREIRMKPLPGKLKRSGKPDA